MKNKKLIFKTLILLLFVSCNKSSKVFSQKKDYKLKDYNLEKYLIKSKVNSLNKLINDFDAYLKDSYLEISSSEERMFEFTNDLLKSYEFYSQNVTESNRNTLFKGQKILNNISFFFPLIKNLKETKLLDDILIKGNNTFERSDTINTWINSILLKKGIEIIDKKLYSAKIDSVKDNKTKKNSTKYEYNCKSVYYYSLYKSSKLSENLIREYIEHIVSSDCERFLSQDYLQRFIKFMPKKDFDRPLLKVIIFTEFYLPLILTEFENR